MHAAYPSPLGGGEVKPLPSVKLRHAPMHPCVLASMHPCTHAHMHPCVHAPMRPCVNASMHPCTHASMHPCVLASMRPCTHVVCCSCPVSAAWTDTLAHSPARGGKGAAPCVHGLDTSLTSLRRSPLPNAATRAPRDPIVTHGAAQGGGGGGDGRRVEKVGGEGAGQGR